MSWRTQEAAELAERGMIHAAQRHDAKINVAAKRAAREKEAKTMKFALYTTITTTHRIDVEADNEEELMRTWRDIIEERGNGPIVDSTETRFDEIQKIGD